MRRRGGLHLDKTSRTLKGSAYGGGCPVLASGQLLEKGLDFTLIEWQVEQRVLLERRDLPRQPACYPSDQPGTATLVQKIAGVDERFTTPNGRSSDSSSAVVGIGSPFDAVSV